MTRAIAQSCDIYFYTMARNLGYDRFAPTVRQLGLGAEYDLPFVSQRYGTVPDSEWKLRKYKQKWTIADSINASIGQGYVLVNPLQLAVMAGRIGGGRLIVPRLLLDREHRPSPALPIPPERLEVIRKGMWTVVNGGGTGGAARLNLDGIEIAGKTGTAQVRRITRADRAAGRTGNASLPFKLREHSLFVCFAPADNPKYAAAVVLEHHGHLDPKTDAAPTARDVLTYMFDKEKALTQLAELEAQWGGDITTRMAAQSAAFIAAQQQKPAETPENVVDATNDVVANASAETPAGAVDAAETRDRQAVE